MAPQPTYYRIYCKECGTYTLHSLFNKEENTYECHCCEYIHSPEKLCDIPEEEKKLQRKRYSQSKFDNLMSFFGTQNYGPFGPDFFDSPSSNPTIIESDAGQKEINRIRDEEWQKQKTEKAALKEEYNVFYKHLGRNDICACGSGKKYKNCCINKFNNI